MAKACGVKQDEEANLFIDDGGFIDFEKKLIFSGYTKTADIRGDTIEARNKTIEIAKNIIGKDEDVVSQ